MNNIYAVLLLALVTAVTAQDYQKNKTYCYNIAYSDKQLGEDTEESDAECSTLSQILPKEQLECDNVSLIILTDGKKFKYEDYAKKNLTKYTCEMPENGSCLTGIGNITANGTEIATVKLHTCSNVKLDKKNACKKQEIKLPEQQNVKINAEICRCESENGKGPCNNGPNMVANSALLIIAAVGTVHHIFNRY